MAYIKFIWKCEQQSIGFYNSEILWIRTLHASLEGNEKTFSIDLNII